MAVLVVIPLDILVDIFFRLPFKSVVRFRGVSKPRFFLLANPRFAKKYQQNSSKNQNQKKTFLVSKPSSSMDLFSFQNGEIARLDVSFPFPKNCAVICGHCDGLVCLKNEDDDLALWNPLTGEYRRIPLISSDDPINLNGWETLGFGYDSLNDNYKIVRLPSCFKTNTIQVFSLKTNAWRANNQSAGFMFGVEFQPTVHLDGGLYWQGWRFKVGKMVASILRFDLATEIFTELVLMTFNAERCELGVFEGCLIALTGYTAWILKKAGDDHGQEKVSWVQWFNYHYNISFMKPICFTNIEDDDGCILAIGKDTGFLEYDTKLGKGAKKLHDYSLESSHRICDVFESLISPHMIFNESEAKKY